MIELIDAPCKNNTYDDRPFSKFVCYLNEQTGVSYDEMADWLGIKHNVFRNKLSRNRFTISDILALCKLTGYEIMVKDLYSD